MSDLMLLGVLRMPLGFVGAPLSPLAQFVDRAREAADRIEADSAIIAAQAAELEALRKVIVDLVDLDDLKARLGALHEMGHGTDYTDYNRLLPLVWAAARAALKEQKT